MNWLLFSGISVSTSQEMSKEVSTALRLYADTNSYRDCTYMYMPPSLYHYFLFASLAGCVMSDICCRGDVTAKKRIQVPSLTRLVFGVFLISLSLCLHLFLSSFSPFTFFACFSFLFFLKQYENKG